MAQSTKSKFSKVSVTPTAAGAKLLEMASIRTNKERRESMKSSLTPRFEVVKEEIKAQEEDNKDAIETEAEQPDEKKVTTLNTLFDADVAD